MNELSVSGIENYAMSIQDMLGQVKLIQQIQKEVMQKDEHYGVIPGTKKNTLFKSGAEKLCMVFRLSPDYEFINSTREPAFIAYTIKCILRHIHTGQTIATGIGSCNSREEKYRYTHKDELTDKPVPKEYWNMRNSGENKQAQNMIGGKGFKTVKNETGQWMIAKYEKVENDNAFNIDNTITKMACKRALVAATLNATAASDIFTQDLEDITKKEVVADSIKKPDLSKFNDNVCELAKIKTEDPKRYDSMLQHFAMEPSTSEDYKQAIEWLKGNK